MWRISWRVIRACGLKVSMSNSDFCCDNGPPHATMIHSFVVIKVLFFLLIFFKSCLSHPEQREEKEEDKDPQFLQLNCILSLPKRKATFFFCSGLAVYAQWHGPWLWNRGNAETEKISEYINWIKQNMQFHWSPRNNHQRKTAEEPRKGRGTLPPARSVSPPANHKQQHGTGPEPNTKQTTQPAWRQMSYSCPSGRHKPQSFIETKAVRFCNRDTKKKQKMNLNTVPKMGPPGGPIFGTACTA